VRKPREARIIAPMLHCFVASLIAMTILYRAKNNHLTGSNQGAVRLRHCERSEAIHHSLSKNRGLLRRFARNDRPCDCERPIPKRPSPWAAANARRAAAGSRRNCRARSGNRAGARESRPRRPCRRRANRAGRRYRSSPRRPQSRATRSPRCRSSESSPPGTAPRRRPSSSRTAVRPLRGSRRGR